MNNGPTAYGETNSLLHNTRTQLSEAAFEAAWGEGQVMDMQKAIEYALEL